MASKEDGKEVSEGKCKDKNNFNLTVQALEDDYMTIPDFCNVCLYELSFLRDETVHKCSFFHDLLCVFQMP